MHNETINLNRNTILHSLQQASKSKYILLILSLDFIVENITFETEWEMSLFIKNKKPSNKIKGFIIASRESVTITDFRTLLTENLLSYVISITLCNDNIPQDANLFYRDGFSVVEKIYPFFLMPEEFTPSNFIKEKSALVIFQHQESKSYITETIKLIEDAGFMVSSTEIVRHIDNKKVSLNNLMNRIENCLSDITAIIFSRDTHRNIYTKLAERTGCEVIGREDLIISIFDKRADDHSGKLKVAATMIEKEKTVFKQKISGLSRIRGGIGLKGPGETKEEERKRILKNKEKKVKKELLKERQRLEFQRKYRKRYNIPTVTLIGYTNAGKSSLFNALLGEKIVLESTQYFSSIDPKIKQLSLFGKKIFLIDTVGFIEGMQQGTLDTFSPTFEEIINASLTLHLIDPTDIDWQRKKKYVEHILKKYNIDMKNTIPLFSKKDLLTHSFNTSQAINFSTFDKNDITDIKRLIFHKLFPQEPTLIY